MVKLIYPYITAGSGRDSITSTHDSYMISSESSEDADEWVAAIKRVLYEVSIQCLYCSIYSCSHVGLVHLFSFTLCVAFHV